MKKKIKKNKVDSFLRIGSFEQLKLFKKKCIFSTYFGSHLHVIALIEIIVRLSCHKEFV